MSYSAQASCNSKLNLRYASYNCGRYRFPVYIYTIVYILMYVSLMCDDIIYIYIYIYIYKIIAII